MDNILNILKEITGSYQGDGVNHEGQKFLADLSISSILNGEGAYLTFKAIGLNGEVFHTEHSMIGKDFDGTYSLFVLSNNHPGLTPHTLKRVEQNESKSKKITFGFGDIQNHESFREEIALEVFADSKVDYRYFWGMPNGKFAERSGAIMSKISGSLDGNC